MQDGRASLCQPSGTHCVTLVRCSFAPAQQQSSQSTRRCLGRPLGVTPPQQQDAGRSSQAKQAGAVAASAAARPADARAARTGPSAAPAPAPPAAHPPRAPPAAPPALSPPSARISGDAHTADAPHADRRGAAQALQVAGNAGEAPDFARRGKQADAAPANAAPQRPDEASRPAPAARAALEEAAVLGEPKPGCGAQPPSVQQVAAKVEAQSLAGLASETASAPVPQDGAFGPGGWQHGRAMSDSGRREVPATPPQESGSGYGGWQHESIASSSERREMPAAAPQKSGSGYDGWPHESSASSSGRREMSAAAAQESGSGYGGWQHESSASSSGRREMPAAAPQESGSGYGGWQHESGLSSSGRSEVPAAAQDDRSGYGGWPPEAARSGSAGLPEALVAGPGALARDAGAVAAPAEASRRSRYTTPQAAQGEERGWRDAHRSAPGQVGLRGHAPAWSGAPAPPRLLGSSDRAPAAPDGLPGAKDTRPRSIPPQAPAPQDTQGRAAPGQLIGWRSVPQPSAAPAGGSAPWPEGVGVRAGWSAEAPGDWAPRSAGWPQPPRSPPAAGIREAPGWRAPSAPPQLPLPVAAPTPGAASGLEPAAWAPVLPGSMAAPLASNFGAADAKRVWAGEGSAAVGSGAIVPASGLQGVAAAAQASATPGPGAQDATARVSTSEAEPKAPSPARQPAPRAWATLPLALPLEAAGAAPPPARAKPPLQPQPAAAVDKAPTPAPVRGGTLSAQGDGSWPSSGAAAGAPSPAANAAAPKAGGGGASARGGKPLTENEVMRQKAEQARSNAAQYQNKCLVCEERGHSCVHPPARPRAPAACHSVCAAH